MRFSDEQLAKLNNITDGIPKHPPRDEPATPDLPRAAPDLGEKGMATHEPDDPNVESGDAVVEGPRRLVARHAPTRRRCCVGHLEKPPFGCGFAPPRLPCS
jgi:hypothetical protein